MLFVRATRELGFIGLISFVPVSPYQQYNTTTNTNRVTDSCLIATVSMLRQVRRFTCCLCGVEYRSLRRIVHHLNRCTPGPYNCLVCGMIYTTRTALTYHMKKDHRCGTRLPFRVMRQFWTSDVISVENGPIPADTFT